MNKSQVENIIPFLNFSFLDEIIAGCARPHGQEDINFLWSQGIKNIVSATSNPLGKRFDLKKSKINYLFLEVYSHPSAIQIQHFKEFVTRAKQNNEKIVIHCQFGQERTGILLAIYLIEFKKFTPKQAIKFIHANRPTSLKTQSSIEYVLAYPT